MMINPTLPLWRFPHLFIVSCQMGDEDYAKVLGLSVQDVSDWLDGDHDKARSAIDRLLLLLAIITSLGVTYDGGEIADWLHVPCRYLDEVRPIDAIEAGWDDKVVLAARQHVAELYGIKPASRYWPSE